MIKPGVPKGTRDFSPEAMVRRNYIFSTIQQVFQLYGYQPIETPAMENLPTLLGKYGEEGDKLLFKILNSGDFTGNLQEVINAGKDAGSISLKICEKGLRYDLTVPFARYVVQHLNEIILPFKRYQIQPVWRADKPQKGRYREFYQCDVDIIGSSSLLNETELIQIIDEVFSRLGLNVVIKLNNRKILAGIAEVIGEQENLNIITMALDKLEKIGIDGVIDELLSRGIQKVAVKQLKPFIRLNKYKRNETKVKKMEPFLNDSGTGSKGFQEIIELLGCLDAANICADVTWEIPLARGLDYYTGTIIEVMSADAGMGSLCGGGRYDDLAGIFGLENISGVGVSFGADRIYDVMEKMDIFPESAVTGTKILFVNFGEKEEKYNLSLLSHIRKAGIMAELYPDRAKLKRQMSYAHTRGIPFVALVGENEMSGRYITLKDMSSGEQRECNLDELIKMLQ